MSSKPAHRSGYTGECLHELMEVLKVIREDPTAVARVTVRGSSWTILVFRD